LFEQDGWTAAHIAAEHGHDQCLEVLGKLKADLNALDDVSRKQFVA